MEERDKGKGWRKEIKEKGRLWRKEMETGMAKRDERKRRRKGMEEWDKGKQGG